MRLGPVRGLVPKNVLVIRELQNPDAQQCAELWLSSSTASRALLLVVRARTQRDMTNVTLPVQEC
jgi:hypothetical protein